MLMPSQADSMVGFSEELTKMHHTLLRKHFKVSISYARSLKLNSSRLVYRQPYICLKGSTASFSSLRPTNVRLLCSSTSFDAENEFESSMAKKNTDLSRDESDFQSSNKNQASSVSAKLNMSLDEISNSSGRINAGEGKRKTGGEGQGKGTNRVYVGNLSYSTSWQSLKDEFREVGNVAFAKVLTGQDGRSRGCGVVEFDTEEDAIRAIDTMTGRIIDGREIFVREDREPELGTFSKRHAVGSREEHHYVRSNASPRHTGVKLFVSNISYDTSWQDLKDYFKNAGVVLHAKIGSDSNGKSRGFGIVEMETQMDAERAIDTLTQTELNGRTISVRLYT